MRPPATPSTAPDSAPGNPIPAPEATQPLAELVAAHLRHYFGLHGETLPPAGLHARVLAEVERPLLELALAATGGNQLRCAELLGLNRNTLRKKLAEHDIKPIRQRRQG